MLPNYYKTLEINRNSTKEDIKKAYRSLAKKYHPDVNKNSDATAKMQEIQEAYYILFDDEARIRYNVQFDIIYNDKQSFTEDRKKDNTTYENSSNYDSYSFNDPILEKWILNAKRQSVDFVKNAYTDTKGILASGCFYYFKAVGICIGIFLGIVLLIAIFRMF